MSFLNHNSLYILLLIGTLFSFGWVYYFKNELKLKWYTILTYSIIHTLIGVLSVKVFAFLESGFNYQAIGNMSLFGGIYFMPVFYFMSSKVLEVKTYRLFDICTINMIFTVMCARINCIIDGCCFGRMIPGTDLRWPTRELEVVFYVILMIFLAKKVLSHFDNGLIYPIYMISYGVFRFICEGFRFSPSGSLIHMGHLWAIISIFVGISIYTELKKRTKSMI